MTVARLGGVAKLAMAADLALELPAVSSEQLERLPDVSGPQLIRVLLDERGLRQRDLVEAGIFSTETVASDVLAGRRPFRLEYVVGAARLFNVPPEAFLPSRELEPA